MAVNIPRTSAQKRRLERECNFHLDFPTLCRKARVIVVIALQANSIRSAPDLQNPTFFKKFKVPVDVQRTIKWSVRPRFGSAATETREIWNGRRKLSWSVDSLAAWQVTQAELRPADGRRPQMITRSLKIHMPYLDISGTHTHTRARIQYSYSRRIMYIYKHTRLATQ